MIELLFLFIAYSPWDYSMTADLNFVIGPSNHIGYFDDGVITLYNLYWVWQDPWGMTAWQHEWMHLHCGHWHHENLPILTNPGCLKTYGMIP